MATENQNSGAPRELFVSAPEDRVNIRIGSGTYGMVISGSNTQERLTFIDMWVSIGRWAYAACSRVRRDLLRG